MQAFPTAFADTTTPLTLQLTGPAGIPALQKLAAKGYEIHLGLTPAFADAITVMAEQPSIREYCPRDLTDRFTNRQVAERWLKQGRAVFLLLRRADHDDAARLAGYGWSARATTPAVPGGETDFALRISETDQGKGLAAPFATVLLTTTATLYGAPHVWLGAWASNAGAIHIYRKLGFVIVNERPGHRPDPNGGPPIPDVRCYMVRPD